MDTYIYNTGYDSIKIQIDFENLDSIEVNEKFPFINIPVIYRYENETFDRDYVTIWMDGKFFDTHVLVINGNECRPIRGEKSVDYFKRIFIPLQNVKTNIIIGVLD